MRPWGSVLGTAMALVLAACGGESTATPVAVSVPAPTPTPSPTPSPTPTPSATQWQLVWSDEFNGTELDRTKWAPEQSCWGGGNNERQCYTDRPENIVLEGGMLHLKARKETFTGPERPPEIAANMLTTRLRCPTCRSRRMTSTPMRWNGERG